jgi:putative Mg2+ transporter-C (MgtC) family protein
VLAGAGYILAAAFILLAHLALRPVARRVDRLPATTDTEVETIYDFRAVCRAGDEAHIRALVVQSLTREDFVRRSVRSEDLNTGSGLVEVTAELHCHGHDGVALENAVSRLSLEPSVSSVTWNTQHPTPCLPATS